jgi:hypothetical protein
MVHPSLEAGNEGWCFSAGDTIQKVIKNEVNKELLKTLNDQADLRRVQLIRYCKNGVTKTRVLDFTGFTVFEVLIACLTFYQHRGIRRHIGSHSFFEGFMIPPDNLPINFLGS